MKKGTTTPKVPEPRFVVPEFARTFRLAHLPLKPATRATLARMRLRTLGDVHKLPLSRFYGEPELGGEKIADLAVTISRVRDGKVVPSELATSRPPKGVFEMIDAALGDIDPRRRDLLLARFGADGRGPLTDSETAKRLGLGTRQNVQQRQRTALIHLLRAAGSGFARQLRTVEESIAVGQQLEDVLKHAGSGHRKREHAWDFYMRILWDLSPGLRRHIVLEPHLPGVGEGTRQGEDAAARSRESEPQDRPATPAKNKKSRRGFASMDPARVSKIGRQGGKPVHRLGRGHEFTREEARAAGAKGGHTIAANREHMARIAALAARARRRPTVAGTPAPRRRR